MKQKKLALSMRGGAARCTGYIGVLKALEENNIKVDMIVGSSGGALIGGSYAAGISLERITEHVKNLKVRKKINVESIQDMSILSDELMIKYTEELLGNLDISETKIKFWAQVTNLETKKCEYIDKGPMKLFLPASSAFPFLAPPIKIGENCYIDGDISGGYGVDFLKSRGAEVVIGIETGTYDFHSEHHLNPVSRVLEPLTISLARIAELDYKLSPPDLLISDLGGNIRPLDFSASVELIGLGYRRALAMMEEIKVKLQISNKL